MLIISTVFDPNAGYASLKSQPLIAMSMLRPSVDIIPGTGRWVQNGKNWQSGELLFLPFHHMRMELQKDGKKLVLRNSGS